METLNEENEWLKQVQTTLYQFIFENKVDQIKSNCPNLKLFTKRVHSNVVQRIENSQSSGAYITIYGLGIVSVSWVNWKKKELINFR